LMPGDSNIGCGLYRDDTRYLSEWDLSLNGETLTLLSANTEPGFAGRFVYGNKGPRQKPLDKLLPEQSVSVQRDIVISNALRERIVLTNYGVQTQDIQLKIKYASDFADMFEVRGQKRKTRGAYLAPVVDKERNLVVLCYQGLDSVPMKTLIGFSKTKPTTITADHAEYKLSMPAKSTVEIETVVASKNGREGSVPLFDDDNVPDADKKYTFEKQKASVEADYLAWRNTGATIETDNADLRIVSSNHRKKLSVPNKGSAYLTDPPAKPASGKTGRPNRAWPPQPRRAASMVAMSIFFIGIIAWKARFASLPPAARASVSARGVICQERPQRSLHQPHWLSFPPLPTIAFQ